MPAAAHPPWEVVFEGLAFAVLTLLSFSHRMPVCIPCSPRRRSSAWTRENGRRVGVETSSNFMEAITLPRPPFLYCVISAWRSEVFGVSPALSPHGMHPGQNVSTGFKIGEYDPKRQTVMCRILGYDKHVQIDNTDVPCAERDS